MSNFSGKKALLQDNPTISWFVRRIPTQWLLIDVNANLDRPRTLYDGVVRQKWPPKLVYEFLLKDKQHTPKAIDSWSREWTNPLTQEQWLTAARAANRIQDIRSRSFQLMFMNRGYYVNKVLAKFTNISSMCTFCAKEEETYTHLYWNCEKISLLLQSVKQYCNDILGFDTKLFTRENFLLSMFESTEMVMVTMLVKKYVFRCRIEKRNPVFKACMLNIRKFIRKDKCQARVAKKLEYFSQTWGPLAEEEVLEEIDFL